MWKLKRRNFEAGQVWCTPFIAGLLTDRKELLRQVPPRLKITGLIWQACNKNSSEVQTCLQLSWHQGIKKEEEKKKKTWVNSLLHPPLRHSRLTRGKSCNIYRKATWFPHSDRPIHILLITSPGVSGRRAGRGCYQRDWAQNTAPGLYVLQCNSVN